MKRVETRVISAAMYELAKTIQSGDGVANAACAEAAERLDEQTVRIVQLEKELAEFRNEKNWTRSFNDEGHLINEHALYRPKLNNT